jgi:hypothetical protein
MTIKKGIDAISIQIIKGPSKISNHVFLTFFGEKNMDFLLECMMNLANQTLNVYGAE